MFYIHLIIAFLIALIATYLLTYPVKKLAIKIGAVDYPNARKIHKFSTPRLGGLAMFMGVVLGLLYLQPYHPQFFMISIGVCIIILTGILDDKYQLRPVVKLGGQLLATAIVMSSGLIIERITIPFFGLVELNNFSIIVTVLWIVGVTNAINLIDGLDGLASGVSTIALISILIMALMDVSFIVIYLCVVLIGSNLGFLMHNFHPASIYMGDTGSMFLGFTIAIISLLGLFKNVTLFSFIIPIIVLAVPIFDTIFAIVRRSINGENIMMPDKKHLHYQLLHAGFSHRKTVFIIYLFSAIFGALGVIFSHASLGLSLIISVVFLALLQLIAEIVGLISRKPLINTFLKLMKKERQAS
ncbi:undecaprenyl/decaprenyl-phosphate alpha-N-acetylglucosaminyl 1-phosphate transferase [Aquibacillus koreensis]|uniref:Undecaprenyl/decaprenyl-phosphate alpha-N-acetylglucosaminyl 1-phosphate transferase n=1 Tax=Aquibacillus koreensis TaxID=279446 RepID=A0A9X3WIV2_9BACI|nr:MraY family glycosyltransferase [Aquibacillus koreensis]MCT2535115.1 undecaprenyl/decaprenyl-phosphate alpha-N-acetylglucosaminyl 1-phosphate transferase [Aquibacillus koreensis]MDC3419758.1 undecaprenyl/decaprenyl-phosphate alpha-N-acetylglucosaminyl 1-phosphate transferase [Aquibacillus koreensis]